MVSCDVAWAGQVRHSCVRTDADHKRDHQCGCGATLARDPSPTPPPKGSGQDTAETASGVGA